MQFFKLKFVEKIVWDATKTEVLKQILGPHVLDMDMVWLGTWGKNENTVGHTGFEQCF